MLAIYIMYNALRITGGRLLELFLSFTSMSIVYQLYTGPINVLTQKRAKYI